MQNTCNSLATPKRARTNFSPSPTYFEVKDEAEILKNVADDSVATARASKVLPLPFLIEHTVTHSERMEGDIKRRFTWRAKKKETSGGRAKTCKEFRP